MTTGIFVAGMRGVGKSTLLTTYRDQAITIEAEKVQGQAVKFVKGNDYPFPYEWQIWDDDELKLQASELLRVALQTVYPNLAASNKTLLVVGALLIKDWFHQAFLEAIQGTFPAQVANSVYFVLHLDEKIISEQIGKRGRPCETGFVNNLEKIRIERDGYLSMANSKWQKITSHESLNAALAALM